MSKVWRLIYTEGNNGYYNMAVDEAIAIACREGVVPPTLRFYTWSPPCISIGYFQKIDMDNLDIKNMAVIRRITGGRAVLHGNDLSYSIVCNTENSLFPDNIDGTYYAISESLITGLKHLGINPDPLNPQQHRTRARAGSRMDAKCIRVKRGRRGYTLHYQQSTLCFATTLGHEISINGRKLIGSAQRRWPDVFLQHGSLIVKASPQGDRLTSISLHEILGNNPDIKAIIAAFCKGFRESLGIDFITEGLTSYEIDLAERLIEDKYSKSSWRVKYV